MHTEWSVECGAVDPWVVIPWWAQDGAIHYIDLRAEPGRVLEVPEAAQHRSLAEALLRWNASDAQLHTAKCDVWQYGDDLFDANDLPGYPCAQGGYIDLLPVRPEIFSCFAACEELLRAFSRAAERLGTIDGRCEWVLRRARILQPCTLKTEDPSCSPDIRPAHLLPAGDGFAATLYMWGYGASMESAQTAWSAALLALIQPVLVTAGP